MTVIIAPTLGAWTGTGWGPLATACTYYDPIVAELVADCLRAQQVAAGEDRAWALARTEERVVAVPVPNLLPSERRPTP